MFVAPLQTSMMEFVPIIVDSISLKPLTFLVKRSVLDIWLGPGCTSGYDTVIKFKQEYLPDSK